MESWMKKGGGSCFSPMRVTIILLYVVGNIVQFGIL